MHPLKTNSLARRFRLSLIQKPPTIRANIEDEDLRIRRLKMGGLIARYQALIPEIFNVMSDLLDFVSVYGRAEGLSRTGFGVALNRDQNLLAQHRIDPHTASVSNKTPIGVNTVELFADVQDENTVNSIARKRPTRTLCSSFAIEGHFGNMSVDCK
jgi:hypothetical protein